MRDNAEELAPSPEGLENYIVEALKNGASRLKTPGGDVFVVAPRRRASSAPTPFNGVELLLEPPLDRAAYSDRTAWLMATLSELAYSRYETGSPAYDNFVSTLADAGLILLGTFDNPADGTQGFLAKRPDGFTVLVFRGTEKDRRDIFVDLDARFFETPAGKAHRGFMVAYEGIQGQITSALDELQKTEPIRLFVAGHSLGGALATAATKDLEEKYLLAACYTFGSPRVGTEEWSDDVKTPIYRVVNGADGVPLLPGGAVMRSVLLWLPNIPFLTWLKRPVDKFVSSGFVGFQHAGDLRFLQGSVAEPSLKIGSAATWARFRHIVVGKFVGAIKKLNPRALSAIFGDHSASGYAAKLRKIAEDRN